MALVSEHPALEHPYCIGIGGCYGIIKGLSVRCNLVKPLLCALFCKGNFHLIEAVGEIIGALAEFLFPFLYIFFGNGLIQIGFREDEIRHIVRSVVPSRMDEFRFGKDSLDSFGHKTCEGIENRGHTQLAHSVDNLVLQGNGLVIPVLAERTVQP